MNLLQILHLYIHPIVQNARPILAKACYIIVECCLSSRELTLRLGETTLEDSTFGWNDHNSRELEGEGPHGLNGEVKGGNLVLWGL